MMNLNELGATSVSFNTIVIQKLTILFGDLFFYFGIWRLASMLKSKTAENFVLLSTFLLPGILIMDHIHFGYHGFLYGLLILSFAEIFRGKDFLGMLIYCLLVNLNTEFVVFWPAFLLYFFKHFCFERIGEAPAKFRFSRFLAILIMIAAVSSLAFLPYIYSGKLWQVYEKICQNSGLFNSSIQPNISIIFVFLDNICKKSNQP